MDDNFNKLYEKDLLPLDEGNRKRKLIPAEYKFEIMKNRKKADDFLFMDLDELELDEIGSDRLDRLISEKPTSPKVPIGIEPSKTLNKSWKYRKPITIPTPTVDASPLDIEKSLDSIIKERGKQFTFKKNNGKKDHGNRNKQLDNLNNSFTTINNTIVRKPSVKSRLGKRVYAHSTAGNSYADSVPAAETGDRETLPIDTAFSFVGTMYELLDPPMKSTFTNLLKNIGKSQSSVQLAGTSNDHLFPGVSPLPPRVQDIVSRRW